MAAAKQQDEDAAASAPLAGTKRKELEQAAVVVNHCLFLL